MQTTTISMEKPDALCEVPTRRRPSFLQLIGFFALVLLVGSVVGKLGWFRAGFSAGSAIGFGAAFMIGLVAAVSSCMAVTGGLLVSIMLKRTGTSVGTTINRMNVALPFIAGRILSYAVLGGALGTLGRILSPSPFFYGVITLLAALTMLALGLDMLHLLPVWVKKIMPRMPAALGRRVMNAEGSVHPLAPLLLGAGTFFLPCGFTQALQLYALTTGSFTAGALALGGFAFGTVPALLALGWASNTLQGVAGQFFFRFAAAAVIVLGVINVGNGLTVMGVPLALPTRGVASAPDAQDAVIFDGATQVIRMSIGAGGYNPARVTIRANVPTRWEVDATNAAGCQTVLISQPLGIQKLLTPGINVLSFAVPTAGTYPFSCSMGMYRGIITVVNS